MSDLKHDIAEKKKVTGDNKSIEKVKMDFKVYEKLCRLFMKEEAEEYIFACYFLILEWNLMAWLESGVLLM